MHLIAHKIVYKIKKVKNSRQSPIARYENVPDERHEVQRNQLLRGNERRKILEMKAEIRIAFLTSV